MPLAFRTVAKVIVISPAAEILLLRRSAADVRRPGEWDIPGGHVDSGEFAEEAAARETLEEAGMALDAHRLQLVGTRTELVEPGLSVSWLFYLVHLESVPAVTLSAEHDEYRWVPPGDALRLITYERQRAALDYLNRNGVLEVAAGGQ